MDLYITVVHHGGVFKEDEIGRFSYIGGMVVCYDNYDLDRTSFFDIESVMEMLTFIRGKSVSIYAEVDLIIEFAEKNDVGDNDVKDIFGDMNNVVAKGDCVPAASVVSGQVPEHGIVLLDDVETTKDPNYESTEVSDTDDGMENSNFSLEDEEHLEVRRNLKWARMQKDVDDDPNEATSAAPAKWKRSNNGAT
ncbi:conserved hypothetical protein [Ricinus communis]|uniref:PB1-like domain-containing protein n=1 Tax=Ricinus communis TaxID=3988 RepID=B9S9P3_RICCO|nr:conserved hypothetical protein [Ricinus communis]